MFVKSILAKVVSLIVILAFTFTMVGCGGTEKTANTTADSTASAVSAAGKTDEKPPLYKIQFLTWPTKVKSSEDTELGKVIKDKFNIVIDFISYNGDMIEKMNLMLAAGDYPELIGLPDGESVKKYISAGALLPLDDYVAQSKYFKDVYKEQIPYWRLSDEKEGKLYKWENGVPSTLPASWPILDIGVRTDALEKQGWPMLESEDSWVNFLKQALKDFPETNGKKTVGMTAPFGENWGLAGISGIMYEKGGRYTSSAGNGAVIWNAADKKFEDYFTNEYVVENLKFFNRLYREGLLDKECFTDKWTNTDEKLNTGRTISTWYYCWSLGGANSALDKSGHQEMTYIQLPIRSNLQIQRNEKRLVRADMIQPSNSAAITKNAKDPKRLFDFIDWCSSDEGQMLLQGGIEGVHYTRENGKRVLTDARIKAYNDVEENVKHGFGQYYFLCIQNTTAKDGQPYDLTYEQEFRDKNIPIKRYLEAYQKLGWKTTIDYWTNTCEPAFTGLETTVKLDPASDLGAMYQKLTDFRVKNSAKLILAKSEEEFNTLYSNLLDEYKKLNPEKVIDAYNEMMGKNTSKLEEYRNK